MNRKDYELVAQTLATRLRVAREATHGYVDGHGREVVISTVLAVARDLSVNFAVEDTDFDRQTFMAIVGG